MRIQELLNRKLSPDKISFQINFVTDLFLNPRRAQCTALAQAEAGAMAAAGTARTAEAKAGPAPEPRWNFFKGF